jgi:hypothetical protein
VAQSLHNYNVVLAWPYRVRRRDNDGYGIAGGTRGGGGTREISARWAESGIEFFSLVLSRGVWGGQRTHQSAHCFVHDQVWEGSLCDVRFQSNGVQRCDGLKFQV